MLQRVNLEPFKKFDEIRVQTSEAFIPWMLMGVDKNGASAVARVFLFYYCAGLLSGILPHFLRATV